LKSKGEITWKTLKTGVKKVLNFGFHIKRDISCRVEQLLASQEGLCVMELVLRAEKSLALYFLASCSL
jgi:hypothetical protein